MRHKDKIKLARELLTRAEVRAREWKFLSKGWEVRKEAIAKRVKRREKRQKEASKARKERLKSEQRN